MIVELVASSPAYFPNGKVGIMDSDLLPPEPDSKHGWVGYAIAVLPLLAIFPKQEEAA
jgi:hypothetical protein